MIDHGTAPVLGPGTDVWAEIVRDDPLLGPGPTLVVLTDRPAPDGRDLDVQFVAL